MTTGTNTIATELEVKTITGSNATITKNLCCTKLRAIELGANSSYLTSYADNLLVKYSDIYADKILRSYTYSCSGILLNTIFNVNETVINTYNDYYLLVTVNYSVSNYDGTYSSNISEFKLTLDDSSDGEITSTLIKISGTTGSFSLRATHYLDEQVNHDMNIHVSVSLYGIDKTYFVETEGSLISTINPSYSQGNYYMKYRDSGKLIEMTMTNG